MTKTNLGRLERLGNPDRSRLFDSVADRAPGRAQGRPHHDVVGAVAMPGIARSPPPFARIIATFSDDYALSRRERQVVLLTSMGIHTKAVAAELGCSLKTVEAYWLRIYHKTTVRSRLELMSQLLERASNLVRR